MISLGLYKHYKGKLYLVIGVGKHSKSLQDLVIYQALYDDKKFGKNCLWVRPLDNFLENIIIDGQSVPRFLKIQET